MCLLKTSMGKHRSKISLFITSLKYRSTSLSTINFRRVVPRTSLSTIKKMGVASDAPFLEGESPLVSATPFISLTPLVKVTLYITVYVRLYVELYVTVYVTVYVTLLSV